MFGIEYKFHIKLNWIIDQVLAFVLLWFHIVGLQPTKTRAELEQIFYEYHPLNFILKSIISVLHNHTYATTILLNISYCYIEGNIDDILPK